MSVLLSLAFIVFGLGLLVKGSDWFVNAAARVAKSLGVSEFVIGLTLVSFGTSFPEFVTSITSAIRGEPELIIGNQVGSVIANMALIIGLAATIKEIRTRWEMVSRDGYMMLAGGFVFLLVTINGIINHWEAAILLSVYYAYIIFLIATKGKFRGRYHFTEFIVIRFHLERLQQLRGIVVGGTQAVLGGPVAMTKAAQEAKKKLNRGLIADIAILFLTGVVVVIGANLLVSGAIDIAEDYGISTMFIGLTIVAVGTSLPELSVAISAAWKGYGDIAVGNIIGANIANMFLNIGVSGLIATIDVPFVSRFYTIPFMIFLMLVFLVFMRSNWTISRIEGIALLSLYVLFLAVLMFGF